MSFTTLGLLSFEQLSTEFSTTAKHPSKDQWVSWTLLPLVTGHVLVGTDVTELHTAKRRAALLADVISSLDCDIWCVDEHGAMVHSSEEDGGLMEATSIDERLRLLNTAEDETKTCQFTANTAEGHTAAITTVKRMRGPPTHASGVARPLYQPLSGVSPLAITQPWAIVKDLAMTNDVIFYIMEISKTDPFKYRRFLFVNQAAASLVGVPIDDFYRDCNTWFDRIVVDTGRMFELRKNWFEDTSKMVLETSYGVRTESRGLRIVSIVNRKILDSSGRVVRVCGNARDITKERMTEKKLIETEGLFPTLVENVTDLMMIGHLDRECNFNVIYCNSNAANKIYGANAIELMSDSTFWRRHVDSRDWPTVKRLVDSFSLHDDDLTEYPLPYLTSEPELIYRIRRDDGGTVWVSDHTSFVLTENTGDELVVCVLRDISVIKELELSLEQTALRLSLIADAVDDGYWLMDISQYIPGSQVIPEIIFSNPSFNRLWEYPADATDVNTRAAKIVPADRSRILIDLFGFIEADPASWPTHSVEFTVILSSGVTRVFSDHWVRVSDSSSAPYIAGTIRDVTEAHQERQRLIYRNVVFSDICENINEVFWLISAEDPYRVLYVNHAYEKIWEHTPEDVYANGTLWLDKIVEEQRDHVRETLSKFLRGEGPYDMDYTINRSDGQRAVIHVIGCLIRDVSGKIVRAAGTANDVTLIRATERRLQESNTMFSLIGGYMEDPFWLMSTENPDNMHFVFVNSAFIRTFGQTPEDFYSDAFSLLKAVPESEHELIRNVIMNLRNGKPIQIDHHVTKPDGETVVVDVVGNPILDRSGKVYRACGMVRDITSRSKTETRLRRANERFNLIANNTDAVFWLLSYDTTMSELDDSSMTVLYVNETFERLWQLPIHLVYRNSMNMFITMHVEDRARIAESVAKFCREKQFFVENNYRLIRPDGSICYVNEKGRHVDFDGRYLRSCWITQDVTNLRLAEMAVNETQRKFVAIADTVDDVLWMAAPQVVTTGPTHALPIIHVNKAFESIFGITRDELYADGSIWMETIIDEHRAQVDEALTAWGRGEPLQCTFRIRVGSRPSALLTLKGKTAYDEAGNAKFSTGVFRDITELDNAYQERQILEDRMRQAQKLESLGVLAGGVAHDFNNLLMIIMANIDVIFNTVEDTGNFMDGREDSIVTDQLIEIRSAAQCATDLTHQMLAYCGKASFNLTVIQLNSLIESITSLLEVTVSKKAELVFHLNVDLPYIKVDVAQVRQVVMNLISNASEAIGDQDGRIVVSTGWAWCPKSFLISPDAVEGEYVMLEVSDTGCGMEEAVIKRIFEPFFTTKFTGRGLGMSAVMGSVRSHNGDIHVESVVGVGTTFTVLLPVGDGPEEGHPEPASAPEHWKGSGIVLLVDDEMSIRKVSRRMLHRIGFDAIEAADGAEAVSIFRERSHEISVVLLDMMMPVMDGAEAFPVLRGIDASVPVVLVSGYDESDATSRLVSGLAGFIQKPYTIKSLRNMLHKLLA